MSPPLVGTTTYATSGPTIVGGSYGGAALGGTVVRTSGVGVPYVGGTTVVGGPTVVGGGFRSSRVIGTTYGGQVGQTTTTTYTSGGPTVVGGISTYPGVSQGHVVGGGIVYDRLLPAGSVQY